MTRSNYLLADLEKDGLLHQERKRSFSGRPTQTTLRLPSHNLEVHEVATYSKTMARILWTLVPQLPGSVPIDVELKHGVISGRRHIRINGDTAVNKRTFFDTGSCHITMAGPYEVRVSIKVEGLKFVYECEVDGVQVKCDRE